jgi:hypothetical protein
MQELSCKITLVSSTKIFLLPLESEIIAPPEGHGIGCGQWPVRSEDSAPSGWHKHTGGQVVGYRCGEVPLVAGGVWWLSRIGAFDFVQVFF